MCGIAGIFNYKRPAPVDRSSLQAMMDQLAHRGPNGQGLFLEGSVGLGHRRLSVIDIETGSQPMTDTATGHTIVYNGEFYNFKEVREELRRKGEGFRTRSDTEVLLKLTVGDPRDWIHRVNGMFAFAVWDRGERALTIVRDRFGVKPLYYTESADGIAFASEIKALVGVEAGAGASSGTMERHSLAEYLAFGHVLEPNTLFAGVKQLPAGHFMRIASGGPRPEVVRYWRDGRGESRRSSFDYASKRGFGEVFGDAVQRRLVSDVPVGSFNSGGVDSSLVTAEMRRRSTGEMHTFSVSFSEPEFDERQFANEVAGKLKTLHHTEMLAPDEFLDLLPRAIWHHDEPLCHANSVHLMQLSSIASKYVTVVLTGEGADEVFFGYPRLHIARLGKALGRSRETVARAIGAIPVLSRARRGDKLVDALVSSHAPEIECHRLINRADLRALCGSEPYCGSRGAAREGIPADQSAIEAILEYERRSHLMSILMRLDKMTMAHGLEARAPFMDYELVLWSKALQSSQKVGLGLENKRILKREAARQFSKALVYRPKVGFGVPLGRWFRAERRFREVLASLYEPNSFVCSLIPRRIIQTVVNDHCELGHDRTAVLWLLLNLEVWAQVMLKASRPAGI